MFCLCLKMTLTIPNWACNLAFKAYFKQIVCVFCKCICCKCNCLVCVYIYLRCVEIAVCHLHNESFFLSVKLQLLQKHEDIFWSSYVHFGGLMQMFNICITTCSSKKRLLKVVTMFSQGDSFIWITHVIYCKSANVKIIILTIWFKTYYIKVICQLEKIFLFFPKPIFYSSVNLGI